MSNDKNAARKHLRRGEFAEALEYANAAVQADQNDGGAYLLRFLARNGIKTTKEIEMTPQLEEDTDYKAAFSADTNTTAQEFILAALTDEDIHALAQKAYEKKDYISALEYYTELLPLHDSAAKVGEISGLLADGRKKARKNFSASDYLHKRLKELCPEKYKKYKQLAEKAYAPAYSYGVFYFICTVLMLICSVYMCFDPLVTNSAIYVIWGIALSVVVHKSFDWDFSFFKSIGGTFLMCASPLFLYMVCDELLNFGQLSFIVVALISAIVFITTLRRDIRCRKIDTYAKQLNEYEKTAFEEEIKIVKKEIVDKFGPQWGYDLAQKKANEVKL